jgi:hypothetical protein
VADDRVGLTLAFDGEREVVLEPGAGAGVRLARDGPWVVDAHAVLWASVQGDELFGRRVV